MKKISTLFKKDPNDLSRVINELDPQNQWVLDGDGVATWKFDGTACMILNGGLYKRYDLKRNKKTGEFPVVPGGAIACQDPDPVTGHWPHWIKCDRNDPSNKYHFEGYDTLVNDGLLNDGTYELCGPKVQGNPEKSPIHKLLKHGSVQLDVNVTGFDPFEDLRDYLLSTNIEGIVWHHPDGRMCKLRKSDFGIKRNG